MNTPVPNATCPECGAPLTRGAAPGLCPRCLMAGAMQPTEPRAAHVPEIEAVRAAFPQYEVISLIGAGGMGAVFKARQPQLDRFVALKILAPEQVDDPRFAERFQREAQALARLSHPHIVTIHDFGQAGGFYFLLMEFVDGVNLRQAMRAGRFTPEQALAIVPPVCEALQYAHEHGIVHRDIKPENLLLDKDGRVKIADFGIAKMLGTDRDTGVPPAISPAPAGTDAPHSILAGTPQYMAPEQKAHRATDHRADIYSLGVVLYELLTGELPADKLQPPSRKVQIDVRLDEIVLRALEATPEMRFQTAADFRTQVETFVSTPGASVPTRLRKIGTSTLIAPESLSTLAGQFFCHRTRGQLVLDDRHLTHSRAGQDTVIPLAGIRDLSIGQYPRTMNPAGIDFIRLRYEEGGQRREVILSPMQGWFAFPSAFNAHVAEWCGAIREAIVAATGRAPDSTPAVKASAPFFAFAPLLMFAAAPLIAGLVLMMFIRRDDSAGGFPGALGLFEAGVYALSFLAVLLASWFIAGRIRNRKGRTLTIVVGTVVLLGALLFAAIHLRSSSSAVRFACVPIDVVENVLTVQVVTEATRGNLELRAVLEGPKLPREVESALDEVLVNSRPGTLVKPTPFAGHSPPLILPPLRHVTRIRFVLPDAALAKEAFDNLRPIGPLPAEPGRTFAGTLFEARATDGQQYRASLHIAPSITAAKVHALASPPPREGFPFPVIAMVCIGGLVLLLVLLVRKGGKAGKVIAILIGVALLFAAVLASAFIGYWHLMRPQEGSSLQPPKPPPELRPKPSH